jgi:hypothetical protein
MRSLLPFVVAASLLTGACKKAPAPDPGQDGTLGEEGRVWFEYERSCFFGCPLEQPLLSGARESVGVDGVGDEEGILAASTDPAVLEVALERTCYCARQDDKLGRLAIDRDAACPATWEKHCDNRVLVQGGVEGTALLELRDGSGYLVDQVEVTVHDAASARFFTTYPDRLGEQEGTALELGATEKVAVRSELYDAEGLGLLAPEGVRWTIADPAVATLVAFSFGAGAEVTAGLSVDVQALAAGTTELTVTVPGLAPALTVTVAEQ